MTDIGIEHNQVTHISGIILEPSDVERGEKSSRTVIDTFHYEVDELLITSGGIGANMPLIRKYWPKRLGNPPKTMIQGVPDSTDGHLIQVTEDAGANIVNKDRMWHYTEGIQNHSQFGLIMVFVSFLVHHQCGSMRQVNVWLHQITLDLIHCIR